ncbi:MAG: RluA family pseudouridine synthase [Proteobacteria bacterium]|nr:RluA family pseudouridine synthase [Pseudomonadota bacterium]
MSKIDITEADRIDKALAKHLPESRRALARLFEDGAGVRVNGKRVKKGHRVAPGDVVEVEHEERSLTPLPDADAAAKLHILVERADVVIVDKPAGMPSQPLKAGELGTAANGIAHRYPECASVAVTPPANGDPRDGGLVHRLDIGTSGILVAARTPETYRVLREAFGAGGIDKTYLAIVEGRPVSRECDAPLAQRGKRVVVDETDGLPAATTFEVIAADATHALVRCVARTGRMHQVRAHLAHCGAPILGDTLYGATALEGDAGFILHAESIAFTLGGARIEATAPLPARFASRRPS